MKHLFLITLLLLSSGPAYAEWVAFGTTVNEATVYVDPATIRHKRELAEIWVLFDYKLAQSLPPASHYLSMRNLHQYNCGEERFRLLSATWFFGNMGQGAVLDDIVKESEWRPIRDSLGRRLMELACKP
jgi:hypothetical protein